MGEESYCERNHLAKLVGRTVVEGGFMPAALRIVRAAVAQLLVKKLYGPSCRLAPPKLVAALSAAVACSADTVRWEMRYPPRSIVAMEATKTMVGCPPLRIW